MEKLKIYLDTNTIIDFFINEARKIKRKEEPRIPKKFEFLTEKLAYLDFVISFITKAEIVRELVAGHAMKKEDIEPAWKQFLEALECHYVQNFSFDEAIVDIAYKFPFKLRTLFNYMHLFIAMDQNAYIISGDRNFIDTVRNLGIYDKALTYIELRQRF